MDYIAIRAARGKPSENNRHQSKLFLLDIYENGRDAERHGSHSGKAVCQQRQEQKDDQSATSQALLTTRGFRSPTEQRHRGCYIEVIDKQYAIAAEEEQI